jgi:hypothetical protein
MSSETLERRFGAAATSSTQPPLPHRAEPARFERLPERERKSQSWQQLLRWRLPLAVPGSSSRKDATL